MPKSPATVRKPIRSFLFGCVLLLLAPGHAGAQLLLEGDRNLAFDRPESWAMKYFASVNLLTGLGVPRAWEPGAIDLGFELLSIPHLSEDQRRVGFNGSKVEDLNRLPALVRPRLLIGLPLELALTISWVPPLEIRDVEPNLWAVALGRPLHESERLRLGLRIVAQHGTVRADFTCTAQEVAAGDDLERNPLRCEAPSTDEMTFRTASLEASAAFRPRDASRWEPYLAAAVNFMDLDFRVGARYAGIVDHTRLLTDGQTFSLAAGVSFSTPGRSSAALELFYSPLDVVRPPESRSSNDALFNVRLIGRFKLR